MHSLDIGRGLLRMARKARGVHTPFKITCLGDSLTLGVYPHFLSYMLGIEATRLGFGGKTSDHILERYRETARQDGVLVVWAGNNNFDDPEAVEADVDSIAALHGDSAKLLVVGLVNGDYLGRRFGEAGYKKITGYNARQAARFGDHFLDIREALIARVGGHNPDDVLPASIRKDKIHLSYRGNWLAARIVYARLKQLALAS
ncbi:SGNH/GDSL hydrolase family protein [Mesorhizobium sp.]|uniref:SGNH/GDSL hydrolase family protein n=1 Tax=Mesorhizobium sp. TaxID=1871066 RepID=UPI0025ED3DF9|nr:SGNH/GDSL hydrolase family protein [Mesorhizobium sp.]